MQPKYCVLKEHTIYLLGLTPPDFQTDYYPSCQWLGDDPKEGQRVADECNARLVRDKKANAGHVRAMRRARAARLGVAV